MAAEVTRGTENGQCSCAYIFRCASCRAQFVAEAANGKATLELGQKWAREAGFSLGGDGFWRCKHCATEYRRNR